MSNSKEHLDLIMKYQEINSELKEKYEKFASIINLEFDNGFGKFLYERFPIDKAKEIDSNMDRMTIIKEEMYGLSQSYNTLGKIEEKAKLFIKIANETIELLDMIFDFYEQYSMEN